MEITGKATFVSHEIARAVLTGPKDWRHSKVCWAVELMFEGRSETFLFWNGSREGPLKSVHEPSGVEVLEHLCFDARDYLEYKDACEWVEQTGIDLGFRDAIRVWNAMADIASKLRRLLGVKFHEIVGMDEEELEEICS